jgi:hypothetical protein
LGLNFQALGPVGQAPELWVVILMQLGLEMRSKVYLLIFETLMFLMIGYFVLHSLIFDALIGNLPGHEWKKFSNGAS